MDNIYYQIRPVEKPNVNGIVVELKDGKLEIFAGESEISEFGCFLNERGELIVDEKYTSSPVDAKTAGKLKGYYLNWIGQQIYWMDSLPTGK